MAEQAHSDWAFTGSSWVSNLSSGLSSQTPSSQIFPSPQGTSSRQSTLHPNRNHTRCHWGHFQGSNRNQTSPIRLHRAANAVAWASAICGTSCDATPGVQYQHRPPHRTAARHTHCLQSRVYKCHSLLGRPTRTRHRGCSIHRQHNHRQCDSHAVIWSGNRPAHTSCCGSQTLRCKCTPSTNDDRPENIHTLRTHSGGIGHCPAPSPIQMSVQYSSPSLPGTTTDVPNSWL